MKNKFIIVGILIGLIAILNQVHAISLEEFDFENVPKMGVITVESIDGKNPNESADLVCISKQGDIQLAKENVLTNIFGKLSSPLEITSGTCEHDCFTFNLKNTDGERILQPFGCLINPPTQEKGTDTPHVIDIQTLETENIDTVKLMIISSTIEKYFISGDLMGEEQWKEFTNSPIEIKLKKPGELNIVYITFANGNLMTTTFVNLDPDAGINLEKEIADSLSQKEAEVYTKLLTGAEVPENELRSVLDNSESVKRYLDPDEDGLMTDQEIAIGTNPNKSDSDNDGKTDGAEVLILGTDPLGFDEEFNLKFTNIAENSALTSDNSVITGFGLGSTSTRVRFVDPETDVTIKVIETMTNSEGVFKIQVPSELENRSYRIVAEQEGAQTSITNLYFSEDSSLDFTLDAINEIEVPINIKERIEIQVRKNEPVTLYGSLSSDVITEETKITAYIEDESSEMVEAAAFTIRKGGIGLYALTLPRLEEGDYEITLQSSNEGGIGPSIRAPINVKWQENGNHQFFVFFTYRHVKACLYGFFKKYMEPLGSMRNSDTKKITLSKRIGPRGPG
jgi:hypothetical protein